MVIYSEGLQPLTIQEDIQSSLNSLFNCYSLLGLTISTSKTEYVVFTRKYKIPPFHLHLNEVELKRVYNFKYLGIIFDSKCLFKEHVCLLVQRCSKRVNFLKTIAGSSWGSHPNNMLVLYKSTIRSILEFGAICFQNMSQTHRLKLDRIQWRSIRICLGLMTSTHTNTCEVLAGILPLHLRWQLLSSNFCLRSIPGPNSRFRNAIGKLLDLCPTHPSCLMLQRIMDFNINHQELFPCYEYEFSESFFTPSVSWKMRDELRAMPSEEPGHASTLFNSIVSQNKDAVFVFTDGSKSEQGTGSAVFIDKNRSAEVRLLEPSNVFTAELLAVYMACELIRSMPKGSYIIASDSMSAIQAIIKIQISPRKTRLLYACKQIFSFLNSQGYKVQLLWVPAHRGIKGNDKADHLAKRASTSDSISDRSPEWQLFVRSNLNFILNAWQELWTSGTLGRFCFSIVPKILLVPWFDKFDQYLSRVEIRLISRIVSNHVCLSGHLSRINIIDSPICEFCNDNTYETPDHILFHCTTFENNRHTFIQTLEQHGHYSPYYIRDILAQTHNSDVVKCIFIFVNSCDLQF